MLEKIALSFPGIDRLYDEPYARRGIIHSEMALILGMCRNYNIKVIIESGRARAQSTYILAKYLPKTLIYSIEGNVGPDVSFGIKRVADFGNVILRHGNSFDVLPGIVKHLKGKNVAVLIDGPKGIPALDLLDGVDVKLGFVHDMRKLCNGEPSLARKAATERFPLAWFTDDDDYVKATAWLDKNVWMNELPKEWNPYHMKGYFTDSYGPTLGMLRALG